MTETPPTSATADNGILRCCNQFPRRYANIDAMTAELPQLAELGFNAVWINPIHKTGKHLKQGKSKFGSLYAIADYAQFHPDFSVVERKSGGKPKDMKDWEAFREDKKAVRHYTDEARKLGMTPMFDLVLVHAAIDSKLVENKDFISKRAGVDTSKWFKRHPNGNLVVHGLDENGQVIGNKVWDDVAQFNYDDPKITDEIFKHLWEPYIDMYVEELGFQGARIDAVGHTPPHILKRALDYMEKKCLEVHGKKPKVLGETLGSGDERIGDYRDVGLTHVTNLAYWAPTEIGPNIGWDKTEVRDLWERQSGGWFTHNMGLQQQMVHCGHDGNVYNDHTGGTVGFCSFHDGEPWGRRLHNAQIREPAEVERGMREKMAQSAFVSDSGWFMMSGDMYADKRKYHVFDDKNVMEPEPQCDLRPFIKQINDILSKQPASKMGSWPERFFYDDQPDLMMIKRHIGFGHDGESTLVLVNLNPEKELTLGSKQIADIARISKTPVQHFSEPEKHGIFCCGGITGLLQDTGVGSPPPASSHQMNRTANESTAQRRPGS